MTSPRNNQRACGCCLSIRSPKKLAGIFAVLAGLGVSADSAAVTILDTGTPTGSATGFSPHQAVAGEFNLVNDTLINEVQVYLYQSGDLAIRLYKDGGDIPGALLYSTAFTLSATTEGWKGFSGLNWSVFSGTYWVAIESFATSFALRLGPPTPLGNEASGFGSFLGVTWVADPGDDLNFGVRISGTIAAAVPEGGSTIGLGAIGFLAVAALRSRSFSRALAVSA